MHARARLEPVRRAGRGDDARSASRRLVAPGGAVRTQSRGAPSARLVMRRRTSCIVSAPEGPSSSKRARSARGSSWTWKGAAGANGHTATAAGPDRHHARAAAHLRLQQVGLEVAALGAFAVRAEALPLTRHARRHERERVQVRSRGVGPQVQVGGLLVGAHALAPVLHGCGQLVEVELAERARVFQQLQRAGPWRGGEQVRLAPAAAERVGPGLAVRGRPAGVRVAHDRAQPRQRVHAQLRQGASPWSGGRCPPP